MDIWFVAAAAGAGYLAKHWQNVVKDKEATAESSVGRSSNEKSEFTPFLGNKQIVPKREVPGRLGANDRSYIFRRLAHRQAGEESSSNVEDTSRVDVSGSLTDEIATTNGLDGKTLKELEDCDQRNVTSLSLPPQLSVKENNKGFPNKINGNCEFSDMSGNEPNDQANALHPEVYHRKISASMEFGGVRSSRKCKWQREFSSIRPLSSLESCVVAQIYKEHVEMEEYVFNSLQTPPSTPTMRPFFITDGDRIISKASNDASRFERQAHLFHTESLVKSREKEIGIGIPPLSKTGLIELPRKLEKQKGKVLGGESNVYETGHVREKLASKGLANRMYLFYLGICIGVMYTTLSYKREVDSLKELLKQTQNLVQDLHEELEMKDSLTVKDLTNEACGFREIMDPSADTKESIGLLNCNAQTALSPNQEPEELIRCNNDDQVQDGENLESLSKIEAELEAELERLEMNINASSLERRLSNLGEFDPDLIADVVHGELRVDMINGGTGSNHDDTSGSSTAHTNSANYTVSPNELSLRLHEVIQSRLQERISELESALHESQKRLHFVEAEWMNSQRGFSNSDIGSPSTQESPAAVEHGDAMDRPLFLNLSGDALNAYDEAYMEFMRITGTDEEMPLSMINGNGTVDVDGRRNSVSGGGNKSVAHYEVGQREFMDISEDDDEDHEDEMGKQLIKQIVEKTRQGSPVVINAQRMLFSMDEHLTI